VSATLLAHTIPAAAKTVSKRKRTPYTEGLLALDKYILHVVTASTFVKPESGDVVYFPKNRLGGMPTVRVTIALKALALAYPRLLAMWAMGWPLAASTKA
jgi:hypothetical protein